MNLKELEPPNGEAIDRNLIENFILESLKRIKDRDIDKFLDDEFELGIENGTWFFLFDSFDEIPEVLSSTEADATIKSYGDAINDFLHSMNNRCRGVVASRQFRGPKYFGWPRFVILSLSKSRQWQLIHKANLKREIENELIGQLETASNEIHSMASNPLFLNFFVNMLRTVIHFLALHMRYLRPMCRVDLSATRNEYKSGLALIFLNFDPLLRILHSVWWQIMI